MVQHNHLHYEGYHRNVEGGIGYSELQEDQVMDCVACICPVLTGSSTTCGPATLGAPWTMGHGAGS
jgi:hypothetical protein